jgi:arginine deiminase
MGERTTPQGVEFLARQYVEHGGPRCMSCPIEREPAA